MWARFHYRFQQFKKAQRNDWAPQPGGYCCLEVPVDLRRSLWRTGCLATHIPFGKTDLDLVTGSSFSLFDAPLQIVSVAVLYCSLSPHLNAAFCSFSSAWTSSVVQGSMFGKTLIYFLMHVDDSSRTSAHTCTHSQNHTLRLKEHWAAASVRAATLKRIERVQNSVN